jgi:acetylornithine deacetylase/succinyl-diaminopimelate desuccinylase-like protein
MITGLSLLEKLVSFKTVSTNLSRIKEFNNILNFMQSFLKKDDFKIKIIGKSNPLFMASKFVSSSAKTIGVYCHYDIQPEDPLDQWIYNPFKLTIRNNKIYGRGVADDKGHLAQNIVAVLNLLKEKRLRNNIVFLFEGEEEIGSVNFSKYIEKEKNFLEKIDFFLINDVGMIKNNTPTIYYALRGIVYFELEIFTGKKDLHSGVYSNLVYNPGQIVVELFNKMRNLKGEVKIPNFYNDVRKIYNNEKKMLMVAEKDLRSLKKISEAFDLNALDKKFPQLSAKIYPSLEINGLVSGYVGEGQKTIIPNYIKVKFSVRLVEHQNAQKIVKLIRKFIKQNLPSKVKYSLQVLSSSNPFYCDYKSYYFKKIAEILEEEFDKKCVFTREGGSIPAAEILLTRFKKPIILTGFSLPDSNIHSPNENFSLKNFRKGINVLKKIYSSDF